MADGFGLTITGDRSTILRFDQFPKTAHDRVLKAMKDIEAKLEAAVVAQEPERTGALRGLTGGRVYDHDTRIAAVVGVRTRTPEQAKKAGALEYGSHSPVAVRAHTALLAHFWARAVSARKVDVPGFTRTPNIDEKRFLRGPIEQIRDYAIELLQEAIDAAAYDASR